MKKKAGELKLVIPSWEDLDGEIHRQKQSLETTFQRVHKQRQAKYNPPKERPITDIVNSAIKFVE